MTTALALGTRERLLDEAERLFARSGVQGTTLSEITKAAEQRNASAVSYHFGSRQGLLLEVLARRGAGVDLERGRLRAGLEEEPAIEELVSCLVVPYASLLGSDGGRSYLRIVAQLRGRFAAWRVESDEATTVHLAGVLDELEERPDASLAVRRERVVGLIMLLTGTIAERARHIDEGAEEALTHDEFVANLVAMCSAVLAA
ncbi:MAG: TetR family transcriptional regulator [Acidimicrobiales bacterium]|nr:TetR family transcriptional regulator [Acidimicrobiales bacterium]